LIEADAFADTAAWDAGLARLSDAFDRLANPTIGHGLAVRAAQLAIEAHRPDVAKSAALVALKLCNRFDLPMDIDAMLPLAYAMSDLGDHDLAVEIYETVRDLFVASGDFAGMAHVDMNVAIVLTERDRADEAIELLNSAANVFREHRLDEELAACRTNLISALRITDRLDDASDVALVLVRDRRAVGDRRGLADALVNGANVDRDADRWEAARERYIEAMEIYRKLNLPTEQADCLDALGVIGRHDGLLDFAAKMHSEAIRLYEGRHHEADKAAAHYNLAITQLQMGRFADAFANAKLATGVRGSNLDPAVVMAAAVDVIGDRTEADRLRTEFIERNGIECYNKELKLLT
jgi:tetratricopeptide (TPR) repeat protein